MEPDGPPTVKPVYIAGGVALLLVVFIWYRNKKASSSSSSGSSLNYGPYGPPATGTGVLQPIVLNTGGSSAPTSTLNNTGGGGSPVPAGNPAATPGEGIIQTALGPMIILGKETGNGPQAFTGYNVGGGAPVYYGNATSLSQGASQAIAGNLVYTPAQYGQFVSATPTHQYH